jgi:archaemetzincin
MEKITSSRNKIVVVPLGEIDYVLVNRITSALATSFHVMVESIQGFQVPQEAYNKTRKQYYSKIILNKLQFLKNAPGEKILGIMDEDLYVPSLNFVLGEADTMGQVAVVSLYRLRQESFEFRDEEKLVFERSLKEATHELGHLFSLKHCLNPKCVMYLSNSIPDTDAKGSKFCDNCLRKLKIGPDLEKSKGIVI